jgi:hypothetical protein
MSLLVAFAVIMIVGVTADVLIAIQVEKFYQPAGLPLFFILGGVLIFAGWRLAIRITARWATPAKAKETPRSAV